MSRPTTIVVLVQMLVLILGFFGLGIVLKGFGYPNRDVFVWNPIAVFLREHGGWFFLLSVLWVSYATFAHRKDCGWLSYRIALIVGVSIALCLLAAFLYAAANPCTMIFHLI